MTYALLESILILVRNNYRKQVQKIQPFEFHFSSKSGLYLLVTHNYIIVHFVPDFNSFYEYFFKGSDILGVDIKIRLLKAGKTQRWLLKELRKRGFSSLYEPALSSILNGTYSGRMANEVLELTEVILSEIEKEDRE